MKIDKTFDGALKRSIVAALAEDVGSGDATTRALVSPALVVRAVILAKSDCVVSGNRVAAAVFRRLDRDFVYTTLIKDGRRARKGDVVARLKGRARAILTGERTALNFMQRMTGIATLTAKFVKTVRGCRVIILDTRKTTPGLRLLEKYAVKCGGGVNHRIGLYDMVLIKDNHRALWRHANGGGLDEAIRQARALSGGLPVEIEVENLAELKSALKGQPDWVLLDNMKPALMKKCVKLCKGVCRTEASGGINESNIAAAARTGVDAISLGCLTHSAPAADLSLEII